MTDEEENKPVHKGLKKGLYLIPSAFTAANIGMGFLSVLSSLRGFQIVETNPEQAAIYFDYAARALGFAILFDTLDGRVARMTRTSTEIGVQLDSLADVLTFGIAPTIMAYGWAVGASFPEGSPAHNIGLFILFMYLMCGTFRLARFNLQAMRPRVLLTGAPKVDKKSFVGLPIPLAAGLIASIIHFTPKPLSFYGESMARFYCILLLILLAGLGLLMVSTIRYPSFKNAGTGRRSIYLILVIAAVGMLVWLYSEYVLLIITASYVSYGLLGYLIGLVRTPKSKTDSPEEQIDITS
jgi:CDP-diacylglycerol---serine O-phosphatidyltransferase